jgi:hypothetical protein
MHSAIRAVVIVFVLALIASAAGSPVAARREQNGDMLASSAGSLDAAERAKLDLKAKAFSQYGNWYGPTSSSAGGAGYFSGKGKYVSGTVAAVAAAWPGVAVSTGYAHGVASD